MHLVMWKFDVMEGKNRQDLLGVFNASSAEEQNAPGLLEKYCCLGADLKSAVEIYVWQSKQDADAYFDWKWDSATSRRWESARMTREDFEVPMVVQGGKAQVPA